MQGKWQPKMQGIPEVGIHEEDDGDSYNRTLAVDVLARQRNIISRKDLLKQRQSAMYELKSLSYDLTKGVANISDIYNATVAILWATSKNRNMA